MWQLAGSQLAWRQLAQRGVMAVCVSGYQWLKSNISLNTVMYRNMAKHGEYQRMAWLMCNQPVNSISKPMAKSMKAENTIQSAEKKAKKAGLYTIPSIMSANGESAEKRKRRRLYQKSVMAGWLKWHLAGVSWRNING
jgi:hypothetical protein